MSPNNRSLELDFLRGIAIILVLFCHHWIGINALQNIGWIGVDLFFVLSGFLVSGLLFKEYKEFQKIMPLYFLIRRGFKIYPLFYTSILITYIYLTFSVPTLNYKGKIIFLLPEIFFYQNYVPTFWQHHWSLAVEEHFYIFLSILIFFLAKFKILPKQKFFFFLSVFIFVLCLVLRIWSNIYLLYSPNFTATHLRIDSLFFGVLISYFYNFNKPALKAFYERNKKLLPAFIVLPVIFAFSPSENFLTKTIGFTILYVSFGALLILMLFSRRFAQTLKKVFREPVYKAIAVIGFYSYSIYLFHFYLPKFLLGETYLHNNFSAWTLASFLVYFSGSIILGVVGSYLIEKPFLKLRDWYFPRRNREEIIFPPRD